MNSLSQMSLDDIQHRAVAAEAVQREIDTARKILFALKTDSRFQVVAKAPTDCLSGMIDLSDFVGLRECVMGAVESKITKLERQLSATLTPGSPY